MSGKSDADGDGYGDTEEKIMHRLNHEEEKEIDKEWK